MATKTKLGVFVAERCYYTGPGELVNDETAELHVSKDLSINDLNLAHDMKKHAKILGWYMKLREESELAKKLAKRAWLELQEEIADEIRIDEEEAETPASKRLNEASIKRRINRDPRVRAAIDVYMYKSTMQRTLGHYVLALTERGRMLQSMNKRQSDEHHQTK